MKHTFQTRLSSKLIQLAGGIVVFSILLLSGCGGSGSPEGGRAIAADTKSQPTVVKVAFWGTPEEISIIMDSVKTWEVGHPDIKIRFEHTPYSGYVSKILTRIAGGAAPDVIATEVNYFVSFATQDVLEPLNAFYEKDSEFSLEDFFPEVVDRFTVDGKVLAVARDTAPFACVFYNQDLFDQAGVSYPSDDWTWADLLEKAKALTKRDEQGRVIQYGFYGWAWQNFVYGHGGALVDRVKNPTACLIDQVFSKAGLQFYVELIQKHQVMPAPVALANLGMGVDMMFASGRLAMFLSGIWESPGLRNYTFRWDVAMFPIGPTGIRRFGTGGTGYAILKSSPHKEAAWQVVKALTGVEAQTALARGGLAQPARRSVAEGPAFALNSDPPANKKMLNEAIRFVIYDPFHPDWREIEAKVITPELELLLNGKQTVDEAARKMFRQVTEMLSEKG